LSVTELVLDIRLDSLQEHLAFGSFRDIEVHDEFSESCTVIGSGTGLDELLELVFGCLSNIDGPKVRAEAG